MSVKYWILTTCFLLLRLTQNISLWKIRPDAPVYDDGIEVSMKGMFKNATKFNSPLDNWYMGGVWNVAYMFADAVKFNQPLNSWNGSYFYYTNSTFQNARVFNQSLDKWFSKSFAGNNLIDMSSMFSGASVFRQNLCPWYQVSYCADQYYYYTCTNPAAKSVFPSTSCPNQSDPNFLTKSSFCTKC